MTFLDLGCGAGGSGLGTKLATGAEVVGIDLDPKQVELFYCNVGKTICGDYSIINPADFLGIEGLHISFPCQGHSTMRSKHLPEREDRELGLRCLDWLDLKPKYFTSENVRGFKKSQTYKALIRKLNELGYKWRDGIFNMADYGVPQDRIRWVLWARLDKWPSDIRHLQVPKVSWYEAIENLILNLPISNLTNKQLSTINKTRRERGFEQKLLVERHCAEGSWRNPTIRTDLQQCWTLRSATCSRLTAINFVDKLDIRRLDIQSIARLQTFPDSYIWSGVTAVDGHGIGNSVPPKFQEMLMKNLIN